ncbi:sigma 54-interacting transcriptional regulator, partial [Desulfovibrio sp. OttesenSCG-928-C14]|nr:sigma 54-interacting transcriptional regulator [Desulfovibrio sp. OttesenSCG-928-C14]
SELFGYEKGSFTGAVKGKIGIFEAAEGGTVLLDEIGELPQHLQVKLLGVLQERMIRRVGGVRDFQVNVRIIAATNRDLPDMVLQGAFRRDLFYRLNILPIEIPPLRQRPHDLVQMIENFLAKHCQAHSARKTFSEKAYKCLMNYSWPGNARELDNTIERLVLLAPDEVIGVNHLPKEIVGEAKPFSEHSSLPSYGEYLSQTEKALLAEAKRRFGTTRKIARALSISGPTVSRKLKKYGL